MQRQEFCIYDYEHDWCLAELRFDGRRFDGGLVPSFLSSLVPMFQSLTGAGADILDAACYRSGTPRVKSGTITTYQTDSKLGLSPSPIYLSSSLPVWLAFNTRRARTVVGSSNNSRVRI